MSSLSPVSHHRSTTVFSALHLGFLLLLASPALAERGPDERFLVAGGAGLALPFGDFGDELDAGLSLSGAFVAPFGPLFGLRAEAGRDSFGVPDEVTDLCEELGDESGVRIRCDASLHVNRFGGGIHLTGPRSGSLAPYAYVTAGVYQATASVDASAEGVSVSASESDTRFGLATGGGVSFWAGERWGINADLRLDTIFADGTQSRYLNASGQLFFAW